MLFPSILRTEWMLGYIAGSSPWWPGDNEDISSVIAFITQAHMKHVPFARGYIAGMVAIHYGVSLWPMPDARSTRPYSKANDNIIGG